MPFSAFRVSRKGKIYLITSVIDVDLISVPVTIGFADKSVALALREFIFMYTVISWFWPRRINISVFLKELGYTITADANFIFININISVIIGVKL